jgi:LacI family transcriptional regulator
MPATLEKVARRARVSPMTVSRVANGRHNVSDVTRQRVLRAIRDLHYAPNLAARSLATAKTTRIALIFANPSLGYLSELLVGALDRASLTATQLVVEKWNGGGRRDELMLARKLAGGVAGVLLPPPLCESESLLTSLTGVQLPIISIAAGCALAGIPSVRIDNARAARDMTQYLMSLGHASIGFIKGHPNQAASILRLEGFQQAMSDAGLACRETWIEQGYFDYRSGLLAAERLLTTRPRPTAIFASNDDMARATVFAALRLGLNVPRDLSVAGFDDTLMATTMIPELTTMNQPVAEMADAAAQMLLQSIQQLPSAQASSGPQDRVFAHRLIKRNSTAPPRGAQS